MEYTYEDIKSLILSKEIEGSMIKLKFQAPNQGQPMDTVAVVVPDPEAMKVKIMKQTAKSAAVSVGTGMAGGAVGSLLGGVAGRAVSTGASMAGSAASAQMFDMEAMMKPDMSDENVEKAILQAFMGLSPYYKMNNGAWEFVPPSV